MFTSLHCFCDRRILEHRVDSWIDVPSGVMRAPDCVSSGVMRAPDCVSSVFSDASGTAVLRIVTSTSTSQ